MVHGVGSVGQGLGQGHSVRGRGEPTLDFTANIIESRGGGSDDEEGIRAEVERMGEEDALPFDTFVY